MSAQQNASRSQSAMKPHQKAWLDAHPDRTSEWLAERRKDGFDIHHIDGDKANNDPLNLVLIESSDHMMLHNGSARFLRMSWADRNRAQGIRLGPRRPDRKAAVTSRDALADLYGVSAETIAEWRAHSRIL